MLGRALLTAGLVLLAACGEGEDALIVTAESVALFPDDPGRRNLGDLAYAGGLVLTGEGARFGGWSGLEVSPDGQRLLAISDDAIWLTASLVYDSNGDLVGLRGVQSAPMLGPDGDPLAGEQADAEGLAPLGEGRYAVSFEREHRIALYDIGQDWSRIGTALPEPWNAPPGLDRLRPNGGMEALARSDDGLWVGIEYPIVDGQPHTIWHVSETEANARSLRLKAGFGLTGLARLDEAALVAVQRSWSRETGNRILVTRIAEAGLSSGEALDAEAGEHIIAELTPDITVDNIEGVAMAAVEGERRLFLISDDNFNPDQRTLLLSFRWREDHSPVEE